MNIIRRLTRLQFHMFVENYYHDKHLHPEMRIGQQFLNRFYNDVADPDLFYEDNDVTAIHIIENDYVQPREMVA